MSSEAIVALAAALAQLGIATAALKVASEVKAAVVGLTRLFENHEDRIKKLEDK